ncbi:MAG: heme ABC transporter permease [Gammaproteobacteria bacterium]|nr:heme ABC transporter permease [Gammaproteobacteria bacterium]MYF38573.1 heme ABC transporter permease [Gammaproteobacteria bacterium]
MKFLPTWMHRLASPQHFFLDTKMWVVWLYVVGIIGLLVGSIWGLAFVPPERFQGDSFRIIFVHVPVAIFAQIVYISLAIAGGVHLVWKLRMADVYMAAATPVGFWLTALALGSGMMWGIPTWGTPWEWDARIVSTFFLLILFLGLIVLRQVIPNPARATTALSILAIVGAINIPIIKYSVVWFNTLHQPASIELFGDISIHTIYRIPLFTNIASVFILTAGIILANMRYLTIERNASKTWVQPWIQGRDQ